MMMRALAVVAMVAMALAVSARAEPPECGANATTLLCPDCLCCSHWGFCGTGPAYCGDGRQSQCNGCDDADDSVASIVTPSLFEKMLPHRNDYNCPASGFFTYDAFIAGAAAVAGFGTTDDVDTRKREVAAWLAQESHDTTGGWEDAPDGPYAWGFCYKPAKIVNTNTNTNINATAFFEMAIGKWMEPRAYPTRPSCHDVVTGEWTPSADDLAAGRVPGFGVITNIIDGDECGHGTTDDRSENRIEFYKRFCDILGVSYGDNLDCYNQKPFGSTTATTTAPDQADA